MIPSRYAKRNNDVTFVTAVVKSDYLQSQIFFVVISASLSIYVISYSTSNACSDCVLEFVGFTIDSPPSVDFSSAIPGTDGGRVTLSETAVKPIYTDINAPPNCDVSQVDMEALFVIIRNYVLINRLRVRFE